MEEIKSIQKLKGSDNYKAWSIQVTDALRAKGVFRYAQGIVPKPKEAQQELQYNWEDKDARPVNSQPLVGWCLSHGWLKLIHSTTTNAWLKRIDPTNGCWLNEWLISQRANL
jgi:hypothetical protein